MSFWGIAGLFLALLFAGAPVFVCLGIATALCYASIVPAPEPALFAQQMFTITEKGELLAIPFFVFAAVLMTRGSSARRIVEFVSSAAGWLPGGMAVATVASCVFFAAMCGLTPTAVVAVGALMLPGLVSGGYPERYSLGLVTSSGSLGVLAPPSLVVLVFVVVATSTIQGYNAASLEVSLMAEQQAMEAEADEDVLEEDDAAAFMPAWAQDVHEDLGTEEAEKIETQKQNKPAPPAPATTVNIQNMFVAGVIPVLFTALLFCLYAIWVGRRSKAARPRFSWSELVGRAWSGLPALLLPGLIIAVIFTGRMTVTQAAAMAAAYALALEMIAFRSVRLRDLPRVMRETGSITGMILVILAVAIAFNFYLTNELVIVDLTEFIKAHFHSRIAFLLAVNVLLLVLGCFMDILSAVFVTVPLLLPAAMELGVDPVHFGIVFLMNFEIGYLTPPIGVNLFTSGAVFKKDLAEVSRSVLPFLGLLLCALIAVTYFPDTCLWLVGVFGK